MTHEQSKDEIIRQLQEQVNALAAENVAMKSIFDTVTNLDNEPEYHDQGMGCGLEDRGITDRYEAMEYGWDKAMERIYGEVIPSAEEILFPATDAAINSIRAKGVEMFREWLRDAADKFDANGKHGWADKNRVAADRAKEFAIQLRNQAGDGIVSAEGGDHA